VPEDLLELSVSEFLRQFDLNLVDLFLGLGFSADQFGQADFSGAIIDEKTKPPDDYDLLVIGGQKKAQTP
jgi:hypothetical protein